MNMEVDEMQSQNNNNDLHTWLDIPEKNDHDNFASKMVAALDPKGYLESFWKENTRPDGRSFVQARPTSIVMSLLQHASGSALVKIGATKVMVGTTFQIGQPSPELPDHGDVIVTVSDGNSNSTSSSNKTDTSEALLQSRLQRLLEEILPSQLSLHLGKACIRLMVTVLILQDDGSLIDCSILACMAAWKDTTLPTLQDLVEMDGKLFWKSNNEMSSVLNSTSKTTDKSSSASSKNSNNLQQQIFRLSLTFGIIATQESNDNTQEIRLLVDPSLTEESFVDGGLVVVVDIPSRSVQLDCTCSIPLSATELALACKLAQARVDEILTLLV